MDYKAGKDRALGFLVGQAMKETKGKANPQMLNKMFAEELKKYTSAEIDFLDERLTSVSAEKILISADVSRKKRKDVIDKLSATIILQDYLDSHKIGN